MTGLVGLGVVGDWSVDIDETNTGAWGLTIRCRGFYVQLRVGDLDSVRRVLAAVARVEDVHDLVIGDMFGRPLSMWIADESIIFRVGEVDAIDADCPALFSVSFDASAERSNLAAALKMALDEAES